MVAFRNNMENVFVVNVLDDPLLIALSSTHDAVGEETKFGGGRIVWEYGTFSNDLFL